jgi:hypothetical protein
LQENLPACLQGIYSPDHYGKSRTDLEDIAKAHCDQAVTPLMAEHIEQLTRKQSQSKDWYRYRAGQTIASRFQQVVHTFADNPPLSLLKAVCYPESVKFKVPATVWGFQHESDGIKAYKNVMTSHNDITIMSSGISPQH